MIVLIRGGGDLASGVALRLYRVGFKILISELAQPLVVRRRVSFAEAIFAGETTVENVTARKVADASDTLRVLQIFAKGHIPILVDPDGTAGAALHPMVIVDARMTKRPPEPLRHSAKLYIGLGPGFVAGQNCHVVVETNRGHAMGRVIWQGSAESDTGIPEQVIDRDIERVLRAPADGELVAHAEICDHLDPGQLVAEVGGQPVVAPFKGALRGLAHPGLQVQKGVKIGDIDPRDDPRYCTLVSDKSLAVSGGVLEAILSRPELRPYLWE
jgi:xanthine dehydrogenase accessory factor